VTARDLFARTVARLDQAGIPYMLTGSFASAYHGRPRATQDIDFVIVASPDQLRSLLRSLPAGEYYADEAAALEALRHESQFNVIDLATGWKLDFICRQSRPFSRTEFDRRALANLEGLSLYVATAEDVILAKLEWAKRGGSQRQLEDVAGLLEVRGPDLDLAYVLGRRARGKRRMGGGPEDGLRTSMTIIYSGYPSVAPSTVTSTSTTGTNTRKIENVTPMMSRAQSPSSPSTGSIQNGSIRLARSRGPCVAG